MGILNRGSRIGGLRRPASRGSRLGGTITRRPSSLGTIRNSSLSSRSSITRTRTPIARTPIAKRSIAREPIARRTPIAREPIARTPIARTPIARRSITRTTTRTPIRNVNKSSIVDKRKLNSLTKEIRNLKMTNKRETELNNWKKQREEKTSYYKENGISDRRHLKILEHLEAAAKIDGHDRETARKIALEEFQTKVESSDLNYDSIAPTTIKRGRSFGTSNLGISGGSPAPRVQGKTEVLDFQIKSLKLDE